MTPTAEATTGTEPTHPAASWVGTPTRRRSDCTVEWQLVAELPGPRRERRTCHDVDEPPATVPRLPTAG